MPNNLDLPQIKPAQCKGGLSFAEFQQTWLDYQRAGWVAESKWDGRRYLLHVGPPNGLTSRRVSVRNNRYVEQQDRVPFLRDYVWPNAKLRGTVLDGELVALAGGTSNEAATALKEQSVAYKAFDVLFWCGQDLRPLPWRERQAYLRLFFTHTADAFWLHRVHPQSRLLPMFQAVLAGEGEGLILKDPAAQYGQGWLKVKAADTHDCVCIGYHLSTEGRFAQQGWIKSVRLGQWVDSKQVAVPKQVQVIARGRQEHWWLVDVGAASGFTDAERARITARRDVLLGEALEVEAQLRFPTTWQFRHPRFVRWRSDKNALDCTVRL